MKTLALPAEVAASLVLNDVHSQLNATRVARVERPHDLADLRAVLCRAKSAGRRVSVSGGRHAMGGQQFATDSVHLDMTAMNRVLGVDPLRGLIHLEGGAQWPEIIAATHTMPHGPGGAWSIRQKQTGVDAVTLAGSISANAHGRGLLMRPIGDDIENLTLVTAGGEVLFCSREENAHLFSLVVGGFGLFGVIASATLRLTPRRRVRRLVDILDLEDARNALSRRVAEGCLYGDFQFEIDSAGDGFLRRGVCACYRPCDDSDDPSDASADLTPENWMRLIRLAYDDKAEAARLYFNHYLGTHGRSYWADTMQLSTYLPGYADVLAATGCAKETLVIGEHYVPRERLDEFMDRARGTLRDLGVEVIYGTVRFILRDEVAFLPWAKGDFACVIFNLRTPHTESGLRRTEDAFRALTDHSSELGGSFYLTYHRYATAAQVEAAYPRFREWLSWKKHYDPDEFLVSDWYVRYRDEFASYGESSS